MPITILLQVVPVAEHPQFLYRCTTGLVDKKANGCIMADEMGLGKTV